MFVLKFNLLTSLARSARFSVSVHVRMMSDKAEKDTPGDVFQQIVDDDNMNRYLGSSGVTVSNICLGTMTFGANPLGRPGQADEALSHQIMDRYVKLGGNFIDTANVYQFGTSEEIVGTWLAKHQREKIVLGTKMRFTMDPKNPNSNGLSRKNIIWSLEQSLERLKTDYIDLYQIHAWDKACDIKETLRTMDDLVRCGKIRYVGASNVTGWQMQKIMDYSEFMGLNRWVSLQAQYSLLNRELEWELTDVCKNEGLGILPWSPLKGGWLTGKIKKEMTAPPTGTRIEFAENRPDLRYDSHPNFKYGEDDRVWKVLDAMEEISKETGKSMCQIALRWLIQQDTVSSVIIGVKTMEQLEDNMGAAKGWELSKEQMKKLNKASARQLPYPYEMINRVNGGRRRSNWTTKHLVSPADDMRFLGSSCTAVSNICLGTMTFGPNELGRPGQCTEEQSHEILDRYVQLRGNFIDTANAYQFGKSEEIIGTWLSKQQREKIVLATKMRFTMDPKNPNSNGLSRKNIIWSLEQSLERLGTDYVDLYQIHAWDKACNIKEMLRTMDDLVRCGKIRYVGASNVTGWQMQKIMDYSEFMGLNQWVSLQAQYSLLNRELELEHTDICRNEGVGILPWSPHKGGWLTGIIKKGMQEPPHGTRIEFAESRPELKFESHPNFTQFAKDSGGKVWDILDAMEEISEETGKTIAQIALRWLIQKDAVSSVIIGVTNTEQLEENMAAAKGWELSQDQMEKLNQVSARPIPYPYEMINRTNIGRQRSNWCK